MFLAFGIGITLISSLCAAEYQRAHNRLFELISQSCITSHHNGAKFHEFSQFLHSNKNLLILNSSYYVHYLQANPEPFTLLAYACSSVTSDYRIVQELCAIGADPNHKYQYSGLYPATYIFKSLIWLYPRRNEHVHYIKNQVQKLSILNDAVPFDSFVTVARNNADETQEDTDARLAVDRCVIKLITPEIKEWLKELLEQGVAPLNFESKDSAYKLQ